MFRHFTPIIAVAIFVLESYAAAAPVELVRNGIPQGVILIASNAPDSVRFAAKELQTHVEKMSGALLPIHVEGERAAKKLPVVVSLGATDFASRNHVTSEGLAPDGFRIREAGGAMIIVGKDHIGAPLGDRRGRLNRTYNKRFKINAHGETGTQFGVYRFLRDQGVRWYMPGDIGLVLPRRNDILFDGKAYEDAPQFTYRVLHGFDFNEDPEAAIWYKRVGYGSIRYVNVNHSFTDWALRFADTHPEYFAVIDGKSHLDTVRNKKRVIVNYTEPGVLDQVLADADTYFSTKPDEPLFGVVPNDSHIGHDERPETLKYIAQDKYSPGWLSDLVWGFVNKVAHEVHKRHPGKEVGSLAYSYQFAAPTMIERFAPNVVVMHCRFRRNFWDEDYKQHVWDNLKAYTELGPSRQYVWEYYNLRSRHKKLEWVPFVMPRIIASDLKALKGFSSGEFIQAKQSMNSWKLIKPGYFHLNLYVTARALWNPDLDIEALLDEYNRLYYGPASGPMSKFWNRLEEVWMTQNNDGEMAKPMPMTPKARKRYTKRRLAYLWTEIYTVDVVEELFGYLDEAAALTKGSQPYTQHVAFMRSQFTPMREMAHREQGKL